MDEMNRRKSHIGFLSGYSMGGLIHILLVIAIVMVLVSFISGRRRV
jgi:uncharacterized membrane protein YtjA (UPF0391 family)